MIPFSLSVFSKQAQCNKIIHAEKFQFERTFQDDEGQVGSLQPLVYIYGTKGRKQWKAKLEIQEFVNLSVSVCSTLSEIDRQADTTSP